MNNEIQQTRNGRAPQTQLRDFLSSDRVKQDIAAASGALLSPERVTSTALTATLKVPQLLECEPATLLMAIKTLAAMGCEPDGIHGHLVPFKTKVKHDGREEWIMSVTPIPTARGLMRTAHKSGIKGVYVGSVTSEELKAGRFVWRVENGELCVSHTPDLLAADSDAALYYVLWLDVHGERQGVYMTRSEVERIMRTSKTYDAKTGMVKGPWADYFDEMAKKTLLKRAAKQWDMPMSFVEALKSADDQEFDSSRTADGRVVPDATPVLAAPAVLEPKLFAEPMSKQAPADELFAMPEPEVVMYDPNH